MRSNKATRLIGVLGTGGALVALLAACGGSGAGSGGGQASALKLTGQQLVNAANKEGSLTWYTTFTDEQVPQMVAAFHAQYPKIKVNAVKFSSEMVPRVTTEQRAGKYNVDVISDSADEIAAMYAADALERYDAPDAPKVPGVDLPSGYRNVVYVKSTVIAWNPTALKAAGLQPPTSWQDLTKPQWKGKFSIVGNVSGLDFYLALITSLGHDKALALVKQLGANSPVLATSHTEATTAVQAGEPVATATAYNYLTATMKQDNSKTMDFVDTKPLLTTINPVVIAKNAPHPAAAKVFVDWLMSQPGQKIVVTDTGHAVMDTSADNDPAVWNPSQFPPAFAQSDLTGSQYNQLADEYETATGSKQ
jgi:iron(III) transport system substrate-binding protein